MMGTTLPRRPEKDDPPEVWAEYARSLIRFEEASSLHRLYIKLGFAESARDRIGHLTDPEAWEDCSFVGEPRE